MTRIKENVKRILKGGSRVYAVVESVGLGKATIRLGKKGNGARLTNLSYAGDIEVGDIVLCTMETDTPRINKLISPIQEEDIFIEAVSSRQGATPTELIAAKVTSSEDQIRTIPDGTSTIVVGFTKDSGASTFNFDSLVWGQEDAMIDVTSGTVVRIKGLVINDPGVYLVSAGAKIVTNIPQNAIEGGILYIGRWYRGSTFYAISSYFLSYTQRRYYYSADHPYYFNASVVQPMKEGDILSMSISLRVNRYTLSGTNWLKSLAEDGFPFLSYVKIAPESTEPKGYRAWWYPYADPPNSV